MTCENHMRMIVLTMYSFWLLVSIGIEHDSSQVGSKLSFITSVLNFLSSSTSTTQNGSLSPMSNITVFNNVRFRDKKFSRSIFITSKKWEERSGLVYYRSFDECVISLRVWVLDPFLYFQQKGNRKKLFQNCFATMPDMRKALIKRTL